MNQMFFRDELSPPEFTDVYYKVISIIAEKLGIEENIIHPNSDLVDDLGADSLDLVELTMEIENEFDIEIPDEDAERLRTPIQISTYIENKV